MSHQPAPVYHQYPETARGEMKVLVGPDGNSWLPTNQQCTMIPISGQHVANSQMSHHQRQTGPRFVQNYHVSSTEGWKPLLAPAMSPNFTHSSNQYEQVYQQPMSGYQERLVYYPSSPSTFDCPPNNERTLVTYPTYQPHPNQNHGFPSSSTYIPPYWPHQSTPVHNQYVMMQQQPGQMHVVPAPLIQGDNIPPDYHNRSFSVPASYKQQNVLSSRLNSETQPALDSENQNLLKKVTPESKDDTPKAVSIATNSTKNLNSKKSVPLLPAVHIIRDGKGAEKDSSDVDGQINNSVQSQVTYPTPPISTGGNLSPNSSEESAISSVTPNGLSTDIGEIKSESAGNTAEKTSTKVSSTEDPRSNENNKVQLKNVSQKSIARANRRKKHEEQKSAHEQQNDTVINASILSAPKHKSLGTIKEENYIALPAFEDSQCSSSVASGSNAKISKLPMLTSIMNSTSHIDDSEEKAAVSISQLSTDPVKQNVENNNCMTNQMSAMEASSDNTQQSADLSNRDNLKSSEIVTDSDKNANSSLAEQSVLDGKIKKDGQKESASSEDAEKKTVNNSVLTKNQKKKQQKQKMKNEQKEKAGSSQNHEKSVDEEVEALNNPVASKKQKRMQKKQKEQAAQNDSEEEQKSGGHPIDPSPSETSNNNVYPLEMQEQRIKAILKALNENATESLMNLTFGEEEVKNFDRETYILTIQCIVYKKVTEFHRQFAISLELGEQPIPVNLSDPLIVMKMIKRHLRTKSLKDWNSEDCKRTFKNYMQAKIERLQTTAHLNPQNMTMLKLYKLIAVCNWKGFVQDMDWMQFQNFDERNAAAMDRVYLSMFLHYVELLINGDLLIQIPNMSDISHLIENPLDEYHSSHLLCYLVNQHTKRYEMDEIVIDKHQPALEVRMQKLAMTTKTDAQMQFPEATIVFFMRMRDSLKRFPRSPQTVLFRKFYNVLMKVQSSVLDVDVYHFQHVFNTTPQNCSLQRHAFLFSLWFRYQG
uniref:NR LBD domain-containing protein n=1 Tax=Caenorhabditis tropicalis TaxID=1561998 RepID=A0A1I7T053_9PELO